MKNRRSSRRKRRSWTDRHFVGRARCQRVRDVVSQQNNVVLSPLPDVLTVDEAAAILRVNRKTLYEAVRLGTIPGVVRIGRNIRISRSTLLGWLQGNGGPALGDET